MGHEGEGEGSDAAGPPRPGLLAVDLGLRTGLALFGRDGRLEWVRSQNLGTVTRLKRAVGPLLASVQPLELLVLEGGGPIADIWEKEAHRQGLRTWRVAAETWRTRLLLPREQRTGGQAKVSAEGLARRVVEWSGAKRPTSALRHDAAEAVAVGLWAVLELGWLPALPPELTRR
jgi:hypothetical protein